ncbi:MAG: TonB-dependent receptor [Steroidobacteraceae bacterium]|jgi:outer membrane receptor protein involved in Fe transport|nr:TonB-dependent receptor [Steroidobacteraceae bacterium]
MNSFAARRLHAAICAALGATAACASTAALAQQAAESSVQLEEIVVTARKEAESLQTAPIAVSAFTAETIAERNIQDINALAAFTPGFSFSQAFGRQNDRPVVRGQSNVLAGVQFGVESGTAYFIDGVYYNGDIQAIDFDSLARVEVIKGPQSALYGRNTYAGAINFVTKDPGDAWEGSLRASGAQHDERTFSASIAGPLAETLSVRVGGRYNEYGGEYTNTLTGKKVGSERDWTVNTTLVWKPTENFRARLFGQRREQRDGPLALFLWGGDQNNCAPGFRSIGYRGVGATGAPSTSFAQGQLPPNANVNQYYCGAIPARPDLIRLNTDQISRVNPANGQATTFADGTAFDGVLNRESFLSLNIDYDVGGTGWTVSSLTGLRKKYDLLGTDSDHSEVNQFIPFPPTVLPPTGAEPLFANTNRNNTEEWSTEVRLASPRDARVRGLVGAYYYYNDDKERDLTYQSPFFGVWNANGNITGIKNRAVFASVGFDVTERLSATAELRYAEEEKNRTEFVAAPGANAFIADGAATGTLVAEYKQTTPRVTVDFQATPDLLLFGVFAKGAKPGGINGSNGALLGRPTYTQETSDNYELGAKATWLDGRLRTNVSLYYTEAKDVQVTQAIPGGGAGAVTSIAVNQGGAEIRGAELEVNALLMEGLKLDLTYSYTDPKFTAGCDDFEYVLNSGGFAYPALLANDPTVRQLCDITGNRLPLVPKTQASAALSFERGFGASDWKFFANTTLSYESSKFVQVHNLAETGETTLLGARLGLRNENWSIALFGRNLTDEDTISLATRWFDLRYGGCIAAPVPGPCRGLAGIAPVAAAQLTTPQSFGADRGSPRAFFATLRKGRTVGLEVRYDFGGNR